MPARTVNVLVLAKHLEIRIKGEWLYSYEFKNNGNVIGKGDFHLSPTLRPGSPTEMEALRDYVRENLADLEPELARVEVDIGPPIGLKCPPLPPSTIDDP